MKKIKLIIAGLLLVLAVQIHGQTLHALLFVNENEIGREIDRKADMDNMKSFFKDIANQIGYDFNLRENSDNEFTASEVNNEIRNLAVAKNDIVIFYYSGHGYNQGSDVWPTLNLLDKDYWLSDILGEFEKINSNAKLNLCIADCCNKGLDNATLPLSSFNPISSDNLKALFSDFKGKKTIIMSASKQGQYSWSDKKYGACFGISLRAAINELTDNSNDAPTWEIVNEKAKEYTLIATKYQQEPQVKIIISANPFEE